MIHIKSPYDSLSMLSRWSCLPLFVKKEKAKEKSQDMSARVTSARSKKQGVKVALNMATMGRGGGGGRPGGGGGRQGG